MWDFLMCRFTTHNKERGVVVVGRERRRRRKREEDKEDTKEKKITKRRRRYVSLVDDVFDDDDALDTTRVDDGLFRTNGKSETSCMYDKSAKGTTT